ASLLLLLVRDSPVRHANASCPTAGTVCPPDGHRRTLGSSLHGLTSEDFMKRRLVALPALLIFVAAALAPACGETEDGGTKKTKKDAGSDAKSDTGSNNDSGGNDATEDTNTGDVTTSDGGDAA